MIGAIFGEQVGAVNGLGIWMILSKNLFRTDLVFGAILITAVLTLGLWLLVGVAERLTIPWYREARRASGPESSGRSTLRVASTGRSKSCPAQTTTTRDSNAQTGRSGATARARSAWRTLASRAIARGDQKAGIKAPGRPG